MVDVVAKPLVAEQGNIRLEPFSRPSPSIPLPPSVQASIHRISPSQGTPVDQTDLGPSINHGEDDNVGLEGLDATDVAHLQAAAQAGDKEAIDLLGLLKIPLGAAIGYGALRGGLSLVDALSKSGPGIMDASRRAGPNGAKMPAPPEAQRVLEGYNGQKLLPAPQGKITDTTGSRFNQGTSVKQSILIPDMNKKGREVDAAYAQRDASDAALANKAEIEKSFATARSMRLKAVANAAAKAIRK